MVFIELEEVVRARDREVERGARADKIINKQSWLQILQHHGSPALVDTRNGTGTNPNSPVVRVGVVPVALRQQYQFGTIDTH